MDGDKRREKILEMLNESTTPISGGAFAKELKVSRQIVVGDIALLRAHGADIIATSLGYMLHKSDSEACETVVKLKHKTGDVFDVLCTVTDEGAAVDMVYIEHKAYGRIEIKLGISSRSDARNFSEMIMEAGERTLGSITGDVHYYRLTASSQIEILRAQKALNDKGYIVK